MARVDVKKLIQELIVPELKEIKSEIRELRARFESEIKRLDEKIDLVRNELKSEIQAVRNELKSDIQRLDEKVEIALQIRERLTALEAKVEALLKQ